MKKLILSVLLTLCFAYTAHAADKYTVVLINSETYCYMAQSGEQTETMRINAEREGLVGFVVKVVTEQEYKMLMQDNKKKD